MLLLCRSLKTAAVEPESEVLVELELAELELAELESEVESEVVMAELAELS